MLSNAQRIYYLNFMTKKILFASFYLFTTTFLVAQRSNIPQVTITGKIIDASSNQPLEYATVVLKHLRTQKVSGGITDEKGNFSITTPKGMYDVQFEFISFTTKKLSKVRLFQNKDFGTIQLKEDSQSLDEISIVAEKSTVEIRLDKRIYNVGKDMTVKGGNASDVLDNVPSVDVDVEGNVSLRGNENVRILIDGKPSALVGLSGTEALRQLPADAIERVEVITSPSARYDAEGTAGILNIILRKGKATGFNGSVNASAGHPDLYQLSTNLNQRSKKINLFSNFGYTYRNGPGNSNTEATYFDDSGNRTSSRIEDRTFERKRNSFNTNIGLEYFLNKKSSITGSLFYRNTDGNNVSDNFISVFDENSIVSESSIRTQDEERKDETVQYSLNYTNNFNKKGHKLNIDLQYSDSEEKEITINKETGFTDENNTTDEHSKNTLIQLDYVLPIGENAQFEAGYRGDFQDLTSDFKVTPTPTFDPSNNLVFNQKINSFYTQYGSKLNKFSFLLGLRTEITNTEIELTNSTEDNGFKYTELFPTINLGFEATEKQSYTLGYSRRLRRPRFWFLNPFESRNSQNIIFKGNPGLLPTFTNSFDLGYLNKFGKFTLNSSIYYQHSTNTISRVTREEIRIIDGENEIITIREPINLASEDRYGFEFTANYNPSRKVRLSGSFNFFQSETEGFYTYEKFEVNSTTNAITSTNVTTDLANKNNSWFARFNARITLPYKIQWQSRLFYRGPRESAQSATKGIFSANLAFSKDILKDKGTLVLNISDLLNSRKRNSLSYAPNKEDFTSITDQTFQWRQRQISLNFTYRFNQKKNQRNRNKRSQNFEGGGEEFGG